MFHAMKNHAAFQKGGKSAERRKILSRDKKFLDKIKDEADGNDADKWPHMVGSAMQEICYFKKCVKLTYQININYFKYL